MRVASILSSLAAAVLVLAFALGADARTPPRRGAEPTPIVMWHGSACVRRAPAPLALVVPPAPISILRDSRALLTRPRPDPRPPPPRALHHQWGQLLRPRHDGPLATLHREPDPRGVRAQRHGGREPDAGHPPRVLRRRERAGGGAVRDAPRRAQARARFYALGFSQGSQFIRALTQSAAAAQCPATAGSSSSAS